MSQYESHVGVGPEYAENAREPSAVEGDAGQVHQRRHVLRLDCIQRLRQGVDVFRVFPIQP